MSKLGMMRYLFSVLCSLGLGLSSLHAVSVPLKADVSAQAALVMNAETGAVLYQKNAHTPLFPEHLPKLSPHCMPLKKKEMH